MRTVRQLLLVLRNSLEKGPKVGYANMGLCGEVADLLWIFVIAGLVSSLLTYCLFAL